MASTTGTTVITGALQLIGVLGQGRAPTSYQLADGMRRSNMMIGSWSLQPGTIPVIGREVFPTVAGKAVYTVGPGGDCNTTRPNKLTGLGLLQNYQTAPYPVEIPRGQLTDNEYQAISIKTLPNSLFTAGYYNATFAAGLGSLTLWPVPDNTLHAIVLYREEQLGLLTSPTIAYDLPEGMDEAWEYNLAVRLCAPNTVPVPPDVLALARSSLYVFKRGNHTWNDQAIDPMFGRDGRGGYDINTGQNG